MISGLLMTESLTFSLESSAYLRTNDEVRGDLKAGVRRKADVVARGKNWQCRQCVQKLQPVNTHASRYPGGQHDCDCV